MIPAISNNAPATSGSANSSGSTPATGTTQVTKNMFLQLLVAQIKNQDPLNPTDGTAFLTQLAQFQQLEQSLNMGQDITAIRSDLDQLLPAAGAGKTGTTTSTSN
jgi:flagellar basal-body rod modification protein FlgD